MNKEIADINLSVVLPAYNDEHTLTDIVNSFMEYIKPAVKSMEIIIIEDGSSDMTPLVCNEVSQRYSGVKVLYHKNNMGYGATLRDGFNAAEKELVFYTDSDKQYDIREVLSALSIFQKTNIDALIGYRHPRRDGIIRFLISKIYNFLFRALFFINVKDVNCSFKLIKKETIKSLNLESESAFIDAEIIWKLKKEGYRIQEIAVTHFPNKFRRTNFINPGLIWNMVYEMFKERLFC